MMTKREFINSRPDLKAKENSCVSLQLTGLLLEVISIIVICFNIYSDYQDSFYSFYGGFEDYLEANIKDYIVGIILFWFFS